MNKLITAGIYESKTIDSREVAEMLGKEHKQLMREIREICQVLESENFSLSEFYLPSEYFIEGQLRKYSCYLITKMGCELLGNKLQGEKGILFTAKYVKRFNEMESLISNSDLFKEIQFLKAEISKLTGSNIKVSRNKLLISEPVVTKDEVVEILNNVIANGILKVDHDGTILDRNKVYDESLKHNISKTEINKLLIFYNLVTTGKGNSAYKQKRINGSPEWCIIVKDVI
jgi:phage regulatory protein, rha family